MAITYTKSHVLCFSTFRGCSGGLLPLLTNDIYFSTFRGGSWEVLALTYTCSFFQYISMMFLGSYCPYLQILFLSVHFGGGSWGVIAIAFLHRDDGILFNWDKRSGLVCYFIFITSIVVSFYRYLIAMNLMSMCELTYPRHQRTIWSSANDLRIHILVITVNLDTNPIVEQNSK